MVQETRGEYVQKVDGGEHFVTATREGSVVTFRAWQITLPHNWYANTRTFEGNEYGQLGTFETDEYGEKIAEFDLAYRLIKEIVFPTLKLDLIGRFGFGEIEVRYCTERAAKQITGER